MTTGNSLRWRRVGVCALLLGTAALYLWHITINGMGNAFYAAATQSGSTNWKALLFGSLDPNNFITVDKPPLAQWVMGLSGRVFGFGSASMLVPEALMAVGTVALLYAAVARVGGPRAGMLAGAALALTPVAVLMFRYNNPDAAMVLLMTAAAYCTLRALEPARGARWLAMAGVALGLAFLAKMLEGLLIAPALAATYLIAAPVAVRTRLCHLAAAAAAMVASGGWFVLLTAWWPASSRPYLAGSTDNDFMNLVLGYNGMARILGRNHEVTVPELADVPDLGTQVHGWSRLLAGEFAYEIGWLVPASVVAVVVVVIARGRAPRTDRVRAATVLFGGWLLVDGLVLSYMHGTVHPYYSLSVAPAVAAMFAIGLQQTWVHRESRYQRAVFVLMSLGTGVWSWWVLGRNAHWLPALRWAVLAVAVLAAAAALGVPARRRVAAAAAATVAVAAALAGSGAYAFATAVTPHHGGAPSVGPARHGVLTAQRGRSVVDADLDALLEATHTDWSAAVDRSTNAAVLELATHTAVMAIGGFSGLDPTPTLAQFQRDVSEHRIAYYVATSTGSQLGRNARSHNDIARWVAFNYVARRVGTDLVFDLTVPPRQP